MFDPVTKELLPGQIATEVTEEAREVAPPPPDDAAGEAFQVVEPDERARFFQPPKKGRGKKKE